MYADAYSTVYADNRFTAIFPRTGSYTFLVKEENPQPGKAGTKRGKRNAPGAGINLAL
jgi:hypothetical protein